jgi:iron complex outermembrane receptor protein
VADVRFKLVQMLVRERGRYSVSAYVNNVENNAIKATSFVLPVVGLPLVVLRPPRIYGLRVSFDLR